MFFFPEVQNFRGEIFQKHMMNLVETLSIWVCLVVPKVAILGHQLFFGEKKLRGKLCWKKAVEDMRQLGTTGTHHPHIILSCKTLSASFARMPSICVGNLFEDVTLQCFLDGRSSPENLGQTATNRLYGYSVINLLCPLARI